MGACSLGSALRWSRKYYYYSSVGVGASFLLGTFLRVDECGTKGMYLEAEARCLLFVLSSAQVINECNVTIDNYLLRCCGRNGTLAWCDTTAFHLPCVGR